MKDRINKGDAINPLVTTIVATSYVDIPHQEREAAKRCVIDTLGAIIAALRSS